MWRPYYVSAGAAAFDSALAGGTDSGDADTLANFIGHLADALRIDGPRPSGANRQRLLAAVAAEHGGSRRRTVAAAPPAGMAAGRRVPGGALAVATIAGGSLLLAGAATQTEAVTLLRSAVSEVPGLGSVAPSQAPMARAVVTVEGRISAVIEMSFTLETVDRSLHVVTTDETLYRDADGMDAGRGVLAAGARVHVRSVVQGGGDRVRALIVQTLRDAPVQPPSATPSDPRRQAVAPDASSPPASSPDATASVAVGKGTPTPGDVRPAGTVAVVRPTQVKPAATDTPAALASTATAPTRETPRPADEPPRTPVPTGTPSVTRTPTPKPTAATTTATAIVTSEPPRTPTANPAPSDVDPVVTATATPLTPTPTPTMTPTVTATVPPDTDPAVEPVQDPDVPDGIGSGTSPALTRKRSAQQAS